MATNTVTEPIGTPGAWTVSTAIVDELGTSVADVQRLLAAAMGYTLDDSVRIAGDADEQYFYIDRDGSVPVLPKPVFDFATAIAQLSTLSSRGFAGSMKNQLEQAKATFEERKACDERRGDSLRTSMEKMRECEASQGKSRKISIGRSCSALVAAIVLALCVIATPLTGGALIGAVIAGAVGVAIAAGQLATTVYAANGVKVQNADGSWRNKDVTIGGLVMAITQEIMDDHPDGDMAKNWSDDKKAKWQQGWSMALNIGISLALMACSAAGYRQIRSLVKDAKAGIEEAIARLKGSHVGFERAARVAEGLVALSDASLQVVDGHLMKMQADITLEADLAKAMKEFLTTLSTWLSQQAQVCVEAFERSTTGLNKSLDLTDDLLAQLNQPNQPSAMV